MKPTPHQQLEAHLRGALTLLMPRDQPFRMMVNLVMMWLFSAAIVMMIPVALAVMITLGLIALPFTIIGAMLKRRKPKPAPAYVNLRDMKFTAKEVRRD